MVDSSIHFLKICCKDSIIFFFSSAGKTLLRCFSLFFFFSCPSSAFIYDESMSYLNLPIVSLFDLFWFIFHHPEMSVIFPSYFLMFQQPTTTTKFSCNLYSVSLSLSLYNVTLVRFIFSTCHFRVELLIFFVLTMVYEESSRMVANWIVSTELWIALFFYSSAGKTSVCKNRIKSNNTWPRSRVVFLTNGSRGHIINLHSNFTFQSKTSTINKLHFVI